MPEINNEENKTNLSEKPSAVSNAKLLEAIRMMKKNDIPLTRSEMFNQMFVSKYLSPAVIDGQEEASEEKSEVQVRFNVLHSKEGHKFFMAFTDEMELNKWLQTQKEANPGIRNLVLRFDDIANVILQAKETFAGFVIDPFGENLIVPTETIVKLEEQRKAVEAAVTHQKILDNRANPNKGPLTVTKHTIKDGTKLTLGEPKDYPQELTDTIANLLKTEKFVSKAYLQLMTQELDGKIRQSYLLVVDTDGDRPGFFETIGNAAKPHLDKLSLDIIQLDTKLGQAVAEHAKPFYERKKIISLFGGRKKKK